MGTLSQKCVRKFPTNPDELQIWGNLTDENWDFFMHNETNWWLDSGQSCNENFRRFIKDLL